MKTITNGNYYRIKFDSLPYEVYEYGQTALEAIATARKDVDGGGTAIARNAVYGEWKCSTMCYRNDGSHSHAYALHSQGKLSTWIL